MKKRYLKPLPKRSLLAPAGLGVCLGSALLATAPAGNCQAQSSDAAKIQKLETENEALKQRLDTLEAVAKKEGILPSDTQTTKLFVKSASAINISGFVTASYFYATKTPSDGGDIVGYLWNRNNNQFDINKVKLTIAGPPVEASGESWNAGYKVSLIFGEDAPIVNTGGNNQGLEALREAFVELNAPLGTGLNIKVGQLISLLNFESGDGGAVNPNFSQGNQWYFTGNGPAAGIQLGYSFTEKLDLKVRLSNGMYTGPFDNNSSKSLMGSFGIKPDSKTSISLIGFGGPETASSALWLKGGSLIASRQLTEKYNINIATEFDYFNQAVAGGGNVDWWSIGGWIWADFNSWIGAAVRVDYLSDPDGAGTSGLLGFPVNTGQDLTSATLTLNIKPAPNIKFQPEIRYDHTSLQGGFNGDGNNDRLVFGAGVSYLF